MAMIDFYYSNDVKFPQGKCQVEISSKSSWQVITAFIAICLFLTVPGLGIVARAVYPAITLALAAYLYRTNRPFYFGFCIWSWILTAEYVRLVEFSSRSFDTERLMLAAPYLVLAFLFPNAISQLLQLRKRLSLFLLPLAAILYAVVTSLVQGVDTTSIVKAVLDWSCPVLLAFFIAENWKNYPAYRQVLINVFKLALILLSAYGIIQFLIVPPWDRYWLEKISFYNLAGGAFGQPEPFKIRVYSLMQSPGEFAIFLNAILLTQLSDRKLVSLPINIAGYLSFFLTTVRSVWGGWIVGALLLLSMPRPQIHTKFILLGLLGFFVLLPLISMEQFSDIVLSRIDSFGNLENDVSGQARLNTYAEYLPLAINSVIGNGLGRVPSLDSAVLETLLSFGWIGSVPYVLGLLMPGFLILKRPIERQDTFFQACKAIYIATLIQLLFGNAMIGASGVVLWGFSGFVVAGYKYNICHRDKFYAGRDQLAASTICSG